MVEEGDIGVRSSQMLSCLFTCSEIKVAQIESGFVLYLLSRIDNGSKSAALIDTGSEDFVGR
jgi:hypothetical protein